MLRSALSRSLAITFVAFALLVAWDSTSLDLMLAHLVGTPLGFPWRNEWFLVKVMHEGAKSLSWLLVIGLFFCIRWPVSILRLLAMRERAQLALTVLASVLVVSLIKRSSATSCPWDLQAFGGVARYVSHWSFGVRDGGGGECFPAGHASAAFAYVGGYFAFRHAAPKVARIWLCVALAAGLVLGLSQQLRGAHYMSHTLWTAWICWTVALVIDAVVRGLQRRRGEPPSLASPMQAARPN
jgi:membrane-associated PAP2 superfamily phosphatase